MSENQVNMDLVVGSGIRLRYRRGALSVRLCGLPEPTTAKGLAIVECSATPAQTALAVAWFQAVAAAVVTDAALAVDDCGL